MTTMAQMRRFDYSDGDFIPLKIDNDGDRWCFQCSRAFWPGEVIDIIPPNTVGNYAWIGRRCRYSCEVGARDDPRRQPTPAAGVYSPVIPPMPMPDPDPVAPPSPTPEPNPVAPPSPTPEPDPVAPPSPTPEPDPTVPPTPTRDPDPALHRPYSPVEPAAPTPDPDPVVQPAPAPEPDPVVLPTPTDPDPAPHSPYSPVEPPTPTSDSDPAPKGIFARLFRSIACCVSQ